MKTFADQDPIYARTGMLAPLTAGEARELQARLHRAWRHAHSLRLDAQCADLAVLMLDANRRIAGV